MINTFSFSYPWWFILFCVMAGVGYALAMYLRETKFFEHNIWVKRVMAILRALSVFIISLLLLSPFVKIIKEDIQAPIIVIVEDKSESIAASTPDEVYQTYKKEFDDLAESLEDKFKVVRYSFGTEVHTQYKDSLSDKSTNMSQAVKFVSDNYQGQNLGAFILCTDGIFNEGSHPLYMETSLNIPLHTVALGDTTQKKDLYFQNVLHNSIAYLGDKFPIQADISAFNCQGNTKITLEQMTGSGTKIIAEENISVNTNNYVTSKNFVVDANSAGVIRYRLRLAPFAGEYNLKNNVKEFYVEVLDARQKILLLANAPHPDLGALKNIITENKNYEVEIGYVGEFKTNLAGYNMVIFHNLPSTTHDITSLVTQLNTNFIPRIFIVGLQTDPQKLNKNQNIVTLNTNNRNIEEIQADINPGFTQFTLSDNFRKQLAKFPPLIVPFGEYKADPTSQVLLYQNIKKIKTNYPLLAFSEKDGIKSAVLAGEGIWRWRLIDHLEHKNYDIINELVQKTILLTSLKADKRKFRVKTSKNVYKDNQQVLFEAQLFNDSYEMVNEPDVELKIRNDQGDEFKYIFDKTQNYYTLNADLLPAGVYTYTGSTTYNGQNQSASGRFNVEAIQLEQYDLTARHGLLKGLSEKFGGNMYYPNQIAQLKDILINNDKIKPVLYETKSTQSILHLKWLFFLILGLLSAEWFMRRYFGSY